MRLKETLEQGRRRKFGAETKVWEDVWIPTDPARAAKPKSVVIDKDLRVHQLIDFDSNKWKVDLIHEVIAP